MEQGERRGVEWEVKEKEVKKTETNKKALFLSVPYVA